MLSALPKPLFKGQLRLITLVIPCYPNYTYPSRIRLFKVQVAEAVDEYLMANIIKYIVDV